MFCEFSSKSINSLSLAFLQVTEQVTSEDLRKICGDSFFTDYLIWVIPTLVWRHFKMFVSPRSAYLAWVLSCQLGRLYSTQEHLSSSSNLIPAFFGMCPRRQQMMAQVAGHRCPSERPGWISWLLISDWPSPAVVAVGEWTSTWDAWFYVSLFHEKYVKIVSMRMKFKHKFIFVQRNFEIYACHKYIFTIHIFHELFDHSLYQKA